MCGASLCQGGIVLSEISGTLGPGIQDAVVVLGDLQVDVTAFARHVGQPPAKDVAHLRVADADQDAVTLAIDALRRLTKERDVHTAGQVLLIGPFDEEDAAVITESLGHPGIAVAFYRDLESAGADALLMALCGPAEPATLIVAADDGRKTGSRDGPTSTGHGAGAVALWLDKDGPVKVAWEVHRRGHGAERAKESFTELLNDTDDDGTLPIVLGGQMTPDIKAALSTHASRLLPSPFASTGALGAATPLAALVAGMEEPRSESGLIWFVPTEGGAVTARFQGRLVPTLGWSEAQAMPTTDVDAPTATRARDAWVDAGEQVAQGAHVSRSAFLAEASARDRWLGQRCTACAQVVFPPREECPSCSSLALEPFQLSGKGMVYARTRIGAGGGPTEFDPLQAATGGYGVAIVTLEEGPRVAAMLTGPGAATTEIGTPVSLTLRLLYVQDGMRRYGFKAIRDDLETTR